MVNEYIKAYVIMGIVVLIWSFEFITAKIALAVIEPLTLSFFKYCIAIIILFVIKQHKDPSARLKKEDIPKVIIAATLGSTLYFACEYYSLRFINVSTLSIILATLPIVSILTDTIAYKLPLDRKTVIACLLSISGVTLIIGTDIKQLFSGTLWGYILAFLAVLFWNIFNFATKDLQSKYSSFSITYYQAIFSLLSMAPFALTKLPPKESITPSIIYIVLFLGIMGSSIGYPLYVYALNTIGVTKTTVLSNFLPVVTIFFSWLILNETLNFYQIVGSILVILSVFLIMHEKKRLISDPPL